jgi:hypothetical protein
MSIQCEIVHAINGRVRLRVPAIKSQAGLAEPLEAFLRHQPGIAQVQTNRNCASVTLNYDPSHWTSEALGKLIQGLSPEAVQAHQSNGSAHPPADSSQNTWYELFLSSTAVALGLVAESVAAPLLPFLLVGSARSMFSRAFESITNPGKLYDDE